MYEVRRERRRLTADDADDTQCRPDAKEASRRTPERLSADYADGSNQDGKAIHRLHRFHRFAGNESTAEEREGGQNIRRWRGKLSFRTGTPAQGL